MTVDWDDLNEIRAELGHRLSGSTLTHAIMHKLLGVPLSTYNEWRPKGKVGALPDYAIAHILTLRMLSKNALSQRVKAETK